MSKMKELDLPLITDHKWSLHKNGYLSCFEVKPTPIAAEAVASTLSRNKSKKKIYADFRNTKRKSKIRKGFDELVV